MSAENTPTPVTSAQTTGATGVSSSTTPMMTQQPSVVIGITPFGNSMGKSFAIKLDRNNYTLWKTMDTQEVESSSSLNQGASLPDHARADTQEIESSSSLNHGASLLDHATPVNSQVHETDASQNIPYDGPLCSQVPVKKLSAQL
ncbi:hypothetical protein QYF36_015358 [Acer negundo]|nr:hypothetical protein QYF36_015358 [Acer negundo]